ncbi:DUF72 domain-containing protein [Rapidithrix thailandica]|uniref:DUF72 domain-containing protein n=1 Tax=Rapidithrix thailandica TaxID=413964 RepID=A0AAW9S204_9BACT
MEFGKLQDISQVDFSLPDDHLQTQSLLKKLPQPQTTQLYVGCPQWANKEWIGKVYPPGTKANQFLQHYSKHFDTVELNSSYYHVPEPETIRRWKSQTTNNFTFCPKVFQEISHAPGLGLQSPAFDSFTEAIAHFEEKYGISFLQLPPYFSVFDAPILLRFLEAFPEHLPLAIEFRHPSWFRGDNPLADDVFDCMEALNIAPVITDVAGRRDVLHQRLTCGTVAIRFVGNNLHESDYTRLEAWAGRLHYWMSAGVHRIYFWLHQPDLLNNLYMAKFFAEVIFKKTKRQIISPKFLTNPVQKTIFD